MAAKKKITKKFKRSAEKQVKKYVNLRLTQEEAQRLFNFCVSVCFPRNTEDPGGVVAVTRLPSEAARPPFETIDCVLTEKLGKRGFAFTGG